jgi:hypothetical protein
MKKIFALLFLASALAAIAGDIPWYPDCHPNCSARR